MRRASAGSASGSSSRKPITSRPYSGRRASLPAICRATRPVPTISVGSLGASRRWTNVRENDRRTATETIDPSQNAVATCSRMCKAHGVDEDEAEPRGQRRHHEDAGQIVDYRPGDTDLVGLVEPIGVGEEQPGGQAAQEDRADAQIVWLKLADEELDEYECEEEAACIGEHECTP